MFYVIYDTVWFIIVHGMCYKGVDIFFRDYSQALKPIAGIDANYFNYNLENDDKTNHTNVFWTSVPLSFVILTINPIIHSLVYLVFSFMFSVVDLNRVLFYILLFKLAANFNLFSFRFTTPSSMLLITQVLFLALTYTNISSVVPSLFQLIDEFTGLGDVVLEKMLGVHASLFRSDTKIKYFLLNLKVYFTANRKKIYWVKFCLMTCLFVYNLLFVASLSHPVETAFCYYSVGRVAQIFWEDLRAKKA